MDPDKYFPVLIDVFRHTPDHGNWCNWPCRILPCLVNPCLACPLSTHNKLAQWAHCLPTNLSNHLFAIFFTPSQHDCRKVALVPCHGTLRLACSMRWAITLLSWCFHYGESPPYPHLCSLCMPQVRRQPRLLPLPFPELICRPWWSS